MSPPSDPFRSFPDLDGAARRSHATFLSIAYDNFSRASRTLGRWTAYSHLHHIDVAMVQTPPTLRMRYCAAHWAPCAVWDKLHAIEQLFRKGYELVLYADGDAAVADWRRSPWDILLAAAQTLARPLPCFLVSTDRGHFGAFGKVNLGVMLLRNCSSTRRALEWVVAREKGHEEWPAEQEQLNKYLRTKEGATWVARVPYCTLQCTVDNGFWTIRQQHAALLERRRKNQTGVAVLYDDWRSEVRSHVQRLIDDNVWIMHAVGAKRVYFKPETGLPGTIEAMVFEAFDALDRIAPLPARSLGM